MNEYHETTIVLVGAPMERQTCYGPFEEYSEAIAFMESLSGDELSWLVRLHPVPKQGE